MVDDEKKLIEEKTKKATAQMAMVGVLGNVFLFIFSCIA